MNKNHPEGEKQAGRQATVTQSSITHIGRNTMDQHRTPDTRRLNRETNEGDTGGVTETMIGLHDGRGQTIDRRAHGTNNKQQAMCSTDRDTPAGP